LRYSPWSYFHFVWISESRSPPGILLAFIIVRRLYQLLWHLECNTIRKGYFH
jgi:hypothetical protein